MCVCVLTAILVAAFQGAILVNWTCVGDFNEFSLILEKDKSTQCMCNILFGVHLWKMRYLCHWQVGQMSILRCACD